MASQAAWISEHRATQDATTMGLERRYENLSALNPAHLKALLGQEVVITLADGSTRTGTVYTVDPVNFTVALLKPRRSLLTGGAARASLPTASAANQETDPVCIIPGHAVKGVEVVGGQRLALEALRGGLSNWQINVGQHMQQSQRGPSGHGGKMALEFLRSYSNPPPAMVDGIVGGVAAPAPAAAPT
eukprot:CAMPEP_0197595432 /NCGR_PEP_ID=MMETSP1326-20131121/22854_1 /TAXON_ID=1155430 /ORGANISM="Genus nov. species nov., Strain RCC2288" /LENGTH=187 /DNA_ID=CAMNT_0043161793 /DNA_START=217 /DNA_END=777 /DNA_ORIENTATION=-